MLNIYSGNFLKLTITIHLKIDIQALYKAIDLPQTHACLQRRYGNVCQYASYELGYTTHVSYKDM
jgi:hypothetical protein